MSSAQTATIVLAAGKGTRMASDLPKVMHRIAGRTMLRHVLESVTPLAPARTVVVLAPGMDAVVPEAAGQERGIVNGNHVAPQAAQAAE